MRDNEYIAALDLGTSKIIAIAARKNEQGMLSILAAEKTAPDDCIRRGMVHNISDTMTKSRSTLSSLDRKLNPRMDKVYVGVGGQSLHAQAHSIKKELHGEIVTKEIIDSLYEECKTYKPEGWAVLDIVSPEYALDGKVEAKPVGVACQSIEATYRLILVRPALLDNLDKSVGRLLIKVAGYIPTPLATAEAVLTQTEKNKGCALVELGAGVTYVSVYKNNILRRLVTIPLGGNVITQDLCDMNLTEEEAELLKTGGDLGEKEDGFYGTFENILLARCNEIAENVLEQINQSGYAHGLSAGVIVTGGGSNLADLKELLKKKTRRDVRQGTTKKTLVNNMSELASDPACSAIIGMLSLGQNNCSKSDADAYVPLRPRVQPTPEPKPEPPKPGGSDLFGRDQDLIAAQEAQRKRLDEERREREAMRERERAERKQREEERKRLAEEKERERKLQRENSIFGKFKKDINKGVSKISRSLFEDDEQEEQEDNENRTNTNRQNTESWKDRN